MALLIFWSCAALVTWTYFAYPVGMVLRGRGRRRDGSPPPALSPAGAVPAVSVVLAVRNGARWLDGRLSNLLEQDYPPEKLDVVVVCNGCVDASEGIARAWASRDPRVRVLESPAEEGKAGALNAGVAAARGDVIVFADVRQSFDPGAIGLLVDAVGRPGVGAVTGRLVIAGSERPAVAGFGRYWRLETLLRMAEAQTGSVVGATGAIYALRREHFEPVPPATLLDDVYIPLRVVERGARVIMEPRAVARDEPTSTQSGEYRRRVRTLAGNLQLLGLVPGVAKPWHPLFIRFMSHKILRVLSPFFFLGMVVGGFWAGGPFYAAVATAVLLLYAAGALGLVLPVTALSVPAAFVLVQLASVQAMLSTRRTAADLWSP